MDQVYSHTQYSVLADMKTVGECTDSPSEEVETRELEVAHGSECGAVTLTAGIERGREGR